MISNIIKQILTAAAVTLPVVSGAAQERIYLLNEGSWQSDNGRLTYFADGEVVSNQWFRDQNGEKLGDTPCDIIQVTPGLIAIAVNWSNIVQFIDLDGKAVGATEDVPNNRRLATDGEYVYVTSYGHECASEEGLLTFEKGFVAKIDASTFKVVAAAEVGYEPEGVAYWDGHLFVANTGGYSFQEDHDYETTVSVVDAATMEVVRTVDTGVINLYGSSQNGRYMLINSPGDYYDNPPRSVVFDCARALDADNADADCFAIIEQPSAKSCAAPEGKFYAAGASFSFLTGGYEVITMTVDPAEVIESQGETGYEMSLPGSLEEQLGEMAQPNGIYVNPYTGYIYATDASSYADAGYLYQFTPEAEFVGKHKVYMSPSRMLAIDPATSVISIANDEAIRDNAIYNLQGIRVTNPAEGQLYIQSGKKFIHRTR